MRTQYIVALAAFVILAGNAANASAAALLADIENAIMCECDDKCGKVLINCNCSTSDKHRATIEKQIESGLAKEQIIQAYVDKYGEKALSAPTKKGFNLTAWIMPFAALIAGGIGIGKIIRTWTGKNRDISEGLPGRNEPALETRLGGYSKQLQSELDKLES
ncbi:MAG: cytochrome c-type biogenesis protein CcmH [Nitrospinae bacterium]|nr:cytochrome c-type biogenesis protein CcmH [Nitrospinota bacterium]